MPSDESALTALTEQRQARERRAADYRRWLADIDRRLKALEDHALIDDILSATLRPQAIDAPEMV